MTLIAGVVARSSDWAIPKAFRAALVHSLSRYPGEQTVEIERSNAFFVKVDIHALDGRGVVDATDGKLTLMTGDPLLPGHGGVLDRDSAAEALHYSTAPRRIELLKTARGVFSGAVFDPETGVVSIFTDKLGVRPIYYTITDEYVAFASVLRVLEALDNDDRAMDVIGVTEIITLGIPLGARTAYTDVSVLESAELIDVGPSSVVRTNYWDWHTIPEADVTKRDAFIDRVYEAFVDGVRLRLGTDKTTVSYLSGGLDSRCVVAVLRDLGAQVHTFSFAQQPNQDQYFAAQFASCVGTVHRECTIGAGSPQWGRLMSDAWSAASYGSPLLTEHPKLVWTGDGGSVGMGFVYMSDDIVALLRQGSPAAAITAYLAQQRAAVPKRVLTTRARAALEGLLESEIATELKRRPCADPARSFYFFLLMNDQRRHLARHFEDIDLHRLEYQLPFFDSPFMLVAASIPIDWGLRHQFYSEWLSRFPPSTVAVPWQTYPGHVPCPVGKPDGLVYQWDESVHARARRRRRLETAFKGLRIGFSASLPASLVARWSLNAAALIHASGLRDYEYVVHAAETYAVYSSKSGKRHFLGAVNVSEQF
jgi:hypothetical protein